MATVRTTAPRGSEPPGNKRKRKRLSKSKSAASSADASPASNVDAQLQTLENWQRAITIDMRELRRECARVRLELEKVDDLAEASVERALTATQAKDENSAQLEKLGKRLTGTDKKLEKLKRVSINEELLMTQLMGLQEQYENELNKVRDEHESALQKQQKQLDALLKMVTKGVQVQEDAKQNKLESMEKKTLQYLKNENSRLNHKLTQMVTRQEVVKMQKQLQAMERDTLDEQGRTRADLNSFEDKLAELDKRLEEVEGKADEVGRAPVREVPPPMPLPPPLPRDLVRQGEMAGVHDALRRVNRDLQAVGGDFNALAKRMDGRDKQQQQYVETRLQELSKQLFDALSHDSNLHVNEISRLKDAVFDLQSDHREFGQKIRRLEDDVQQVTAARARSRSPPRDRAGPGWRYGQNQQPVLPTPPIPPPPPAHRNRRERPSRYEPAPDLRGNAAPAFQPPVQDRIRWEPRRRSRSRSPPRRPSWGAAGSSSSRSDSAQNDRRPQREDQRHNPDRSNSGNTASAGNNVTELSDSPPSRPDGDNREIVGGQSNLPFRRSRQPRRTPEVIVIEEDDDDENEDEENGDRGGNNVAPEGENEEAAGDSAPSRARPDVVLDEEEASQEADVTVVAPPNSSITGHVESTDHLEKEADLQTGFLLYFCLGGAPDLDVQWTNCFSQLSAEERVEMPRMLSFQRRYGFLQTRPVLTQCILQAVILNGQNVPGGIDSRPTGVLTASSIDAKFDEVVKNIHLSWVKALIEHLSKLANSIDDLASQKLELSLNPAGVSAELDKDEIIYEWSRRQESVMWILARKLHYGSFLPSMKCNVNASPAVYLFTLMFDVRMVTSACPQFGTFRLNTFGAKLMAYLWDQTLNMLPYWDWSWLDGQSTKHKLPALGFCHLLASILLWNSAIDRHSLTNRSIYAAAVKHLLPKLNVGGHPVHGPEDTEATILLLGECESTRIEFWDLDSKFASILGLDGFFEVMEAIQNNMLAVAAAARARSS